VSLPQDVKTGAPPRGQHRVANVLQGLPTNPGRFAPPLRSGGLAIEQGSRVALFGSFTYKSNVTGLGRDIALGLAAKGYRVFGTAITPGEITDLQQASGGAVTLTSCDITDEPAVKRWARAVSVQTDGGLNLLISNAGILTPGPIETLPLDSIRREFEVNVFGALSVVNAFLPALRKARGRIVQVSTWTAHLPLPFNGPSGASKAAMEVFATVYREELKRFGIDVVVAVAGNIKTGGLPRQPPRSRAPRRK
jgi:NAD(P)-dependent dehydrogenase (short-subunit alcohol dehydrogenase family)